MDAGEVVALDLEASMVNKFIMLQDIQDHLQRLPHSQRVHIADELRFSAAQRCKRLTFALPLDQSSTPKCQDTLISTESLRGMRGIR